MQAYSPDLQITAIFRGYAVYLYLTWISAAGQYFSISVRGRFLWRFYQNLLFFFYKYGIISNDTQWILQIIPNDRMYSDTYVT